MINRRALPKIDFEFYDYGQQLEMELALEMTFIRNNVPLISPSTTIATKDKDRRCK
jgi:hypothetical protein